MWSPWAWVRAIRTIGAPRRLGRREHGLLASGEQRVDQRQAVVVGHQVGVHEAAPGELHQVLSMTSDVHRSSFVAE